MNRKTTFLFSYNSLLFFLILVVFPSTLLIFAQTITPQKLPFSSICAGGPKESEPGAIFNEYQAQFTISGFDATETFVVELSDASGSFLNPTATIPLGALPGTPPDTSTFRTLTFAVPNDLIGSNSYQLRVRSASGAGSPSGSFTIFGSISEKFFAAYFKPYNKSFYIADKRASISFCTGSSVTLTVDNPTPEDADSSPANFPQLKYNWYKDDNLIANQTSSSLVVNSGGVYYAKLNYGPCSSENIRSQDVTIMSSAGNGGSASVSSSLGNPFCSGSETTTLTATAGNSYIWKNNGVIIPGANSQTYNTSIAGVFSCDIDFGGCSATASINLKTNGSISANGNVIAEGQTLPIDQGDTLTVTASTNVSNPSFQWYLNNNEISGANQSTLDITFAGTYKVIISGCSLSFNVSYDSIINYNVPNVANVVSPNNDGTNDTWILPDDYNNTNTHVTIFSSFGEIVFETSNYDNYNGWPQSSIDFKNFNPVFYYIITPNGQSAKKGSITLLK